ncbi:hypothetical protein [Pseudoxanthomonas wuyuanensis]
MADELDSEEVLAVILEHLDVLVLLEQGSPNGRTEVLEQVTAAMAEHPEDARARAAAAVEALTVQATVIDQADFDRILSRLREVEGLHSIQDVQYIGLGARGERVMSLRSELPQAEEDDLTEEDRLGISRYVASNLGIDLGIPPDEFGGGMRP